MEKTVKILIPTIKQYIMPDDKDTYIPIQVGRDEVEEDLGYLCDNTGDNISYKHRYYSELSATYWGWKNLECDIVGLCHHRRFFCSKVSKPATYKKHEMILSKEEIMHLIEQYPVIVTKRRNYYIESKESQFNHAHNKEDMGLCRTVVSELYPDCVDVFNCVMSRTWQHNYNMFIMKKEFADDYCDWLFSILFELEKRIDFNKYKDPYQSRVLGYIGERLLDVWLEYRKIEYKEVPVVMLEKQNWPKKIFRFLKRKIKPELRKSSD